jgi:membrane protein YdbS with pleckstrin-like domain
MAFPRRLLIDGEELVLDLRPHPIALAEAALVAIVGIAAAGWLMSKHWTPWWVWGLLLVVLLVWYPVRRFVSWFTENFVVTSERVIHRRGLIAKRSMEIPLESITDIRFEQGIIDRMVGAGTLILSSASEFGRNSFRDIRHPEEVQKTIYHQGELNKKRMYRGEPAPTMPAAPTAPSSTGVPSATTELERLAKLRNDGVLTEEEFQAQKARILRGQG